MDHNQTGNLNLHMSLVTHRMKVRLSEIKNTVCKIMNFVGYQPVEIENMHLKLVSRILNVKTRSKKNQTVL